MSKVVFIDRKKMQIYIVLAAVIILAGAYIGWQQTKPASATMAEPQVVQLVTGEFKGTSEDGKTFESYVWNPGTVFVKKDQPVELRISGINGDAHHFVIEGMDISGEIQKGKTTVVKFTPTKEGIFPIVCELHTHPANGGPMVGYLVVD